MYTYTEISMSVVVFVHLYIYEKHPLLPCNPISSLANHCIVDFSLPHPFDVVILVINLFLFEFVQLWGLRGILPHPLRRGWWSAGERTGWCDRASVWQGVRCLSFSCTHPMQSRRPLVWWWQRSTTLDLFVCVRASPGWVHMDNMYTWTHSQTCSWICVCIRCKDKCDVRIDSRNFQPIL